jgi:Na+/proline symporter
MIPYDIDDIRHELYWAVATWVMLGLVNLTPAIDHGGYWWIPSVIGLIACLLCARRAYRLAKSAHH